MRSQVDTTVDGWLGDAVRPTPVRLAVGLTVALAFAVPAVALAARRFLPPPIPLLAALGVVGVGYVAFLWVHDRLLLGTAVGAVVLATFGANVPIAALDGGFVGTVVGDVWLVQAPLLALAVVLVRRGTRDVFQPLSTRTLAGFMVWSALAAVFGAGPDPAVALHFTLFVAFGLVAFLATQWLVVTRQLSVRTLLSVFVVAVGGHTLVALVQLAAGRPFGLTQLGEGAPVVVSVATVPFVGDVPFGTFVGGFTGMSFNLANLLVLALPPFLVLAYRAVGARWVLAVPVAVAFGVVRASSTDAGRGALLLALIAFALGTLWAYRDGVETAARRAAPWRLLGVVCLALPLVFYPSSRSGQSSTSGAPTGTGSTGGSGATSASAVDRWLAWVTTSSIPLFDLSNLGIRLEQYVAGLVVFRQYPLFGVGGMNYVLVAGRYGVDPRAGGVLPYPIHNIYITLLAETGLVGCLLYIGTLALVFLAGVRLLRSPETDRLLVAGVVAGLVGSLAFGFWDHLQLYHATGFVPLWILAGALVGEARRVRQAPSSSV